MRPTRASSPDHLETTRPRWRRLPFALALLLVATVAACAAERTCGAGTVAADGRCVPAGEVCGAGTTLVDGVCAPACPAGSAWDGAACATVTGCGAGTVLDETTGACVLEAGACAAGTRLEGGRCVPIGSPCGAGTHEQDGVCVLDQLPPPDVAEAGEPDGEAPFTLPAAGDTVVLGGTIDTPADRDGDGFADDDWDTFTFTATAGTYLRLRATSVGAAMPAFVLESRERGPSGYPLYARYAIEPNHLDCVREFYLPRDGEYRLGVSDYRHVVGWLFGLGYLPLGGPDFTYQVTVENRGAPAPVPWGTLPAAVDGDADEGALRFYTTPSLAVDDIIELTSATVASGPEGSNLFPILTVVDPAGALLGEKISYSSDTPVELFFAAAQAGEHLVVHDHLLATGPRRAFHLDAALRVPVDCTGSPCTGGAIAEAGDELLAWNVAPGELAAISVSLPAGAAGAVRVQFLDAAMRLLLPEHNATASTPGYGYAYAEQATRVLMRLRSTNGAAIPAYTLDPRLIPTTAITPGQPVVGAPVHDLPTGVWHDCGLGHVVGDPGTVLLATGLGVTGAMTTPQPELLDPRLGRIGPALDVTATNFPYALVTPLMTYVPRAGHYLYHLFDASSRDLSGVSYDVDVEALTGVALGTLASTPLEATGQSLGSATGMALFAFSGAPGQSATVTVTPTAPATLRPEVWVLTPGRAVRVGSTQTWQADATAAQLGLLDQAAATGGGAVASLTHEVRYDGPTLVIVRDADGAPVAGDTFTLGVSQ